MCKQRGLPGTSTPSRVPGVLVWGSPDWEGAGRRRRPRNRLQEVSLDGGSGAGEDDGGNGAGEDDGSWGLCSQDRGLCSQDWGLCPLPPSAGVRGSETHPGTGPWGWDTHLDGLGLVGTSRGRAQPGLARQRGSGGSSLEPYWAGKSQKTTATVVQKLWGLNLNFPCPRAGLKTGNEAGNNLLIMTFNAKEAAEENPEQAGTEFKDGAEPGQVGTQCRGLPSLGAARSIEATLGPGFVRLTHAAGSS